MKQVGKWTEMRAADFIEFNPRMSIKKGTIATKVAMDKLQPFTKKIPDTEKAPFSGGSKFRKSVLVNDEVIQGIRSLIPLAPLHNGPARGWSGAWSAVSISPTTRPI